MRGMTNFPRIRYLDWAKRNFDLSPPAYDLASSGMETASMADLGLDGASMLPALGAAPQGHAGLKKALGEWLGVPASCVVPANGTTGANFLAQATLVRPGDEVWCEWPAYEPLWRSLETLGAKVRWLPRDPERAFVPDVGVVAEAYAKGARLVVLSDLHNPSASLLPREAVREMARLAARHDGWLMVDEVYLSGADAGPIDTAAKLGSRVVTTGSLTKTFGLGMLRAGWVLAPESLVPRLLEVNDHLGAQRPYVADEVAVRALGRIEHLAARARARRAENWPLVKAALSGGPGLELHESEGAFIAWARLPAGLEADAFVERLRREHDTLVVPGGFFGRPDHVRIGFGGRRERLEEGLRRLASALRG
jgi:aspartate/methionine/tyrosine aminotransferase